VGVVVAVEFLSTKKQSSSLTLYGALVVALAMLLRFINCCVIIIIIVFLYIFCTLGSKDPEG